MGASGVLIDQTALCEAARLLAGVSTPGARESMRAVVPGTAERLAHLSTLLDALLLYDEVWVLDAQLPSDAEQLTLRQVLLDRGILRYVDTRALSGKVSEELTGFLRDAEAGPRQSTGLHSHPYASAEEVGHSVRQLLDHANESRSGALVHALHSDFEGDLAHWWIGKWAEELHADPMRVLGTETLHFIGYWGSGAITGGVSHLRTFIYWRTAAHLRIPFLPSLRRLPVYHLMTDHVRRTVQDRVYEVVADSFRATVAEVYEDEEPLALYLPPALSLFLDHLRAHGDIAAAVDALRHQHRRLRRSLSELQQTLDTSSSLGEARAARKRLKAALEVLRADLDPGDRAAGGTVDQLIEIVPGVVKAAANPLDVGGYADALLARPSDWIRSWWLRRPVRSALRLSTRLEDLGRYDRLLEEATGRRCDPAEVEALRSSYGRDLEFYGGDSRLPSAPPVATAGESSEQEPA